MSAPMDEPHRSGFTSTAAKAVAAFVAVGVLVIGAKAIAGHDSDTAAAGTPPVAGGQAPPGMTPGGRIGHDRNGMPPGFGAPVTGATLDKLKSVVTPKYAGTIERAMRLPDGSYVVHVIGTNGEVHVHVTKDLRIDGTDTGGPGGMPPGAPAPSGTTTKS
jgi:hypothetical protein